MKKLKIYLDSTIIGFSINRKEKEKYRDANKLLSQIKNGLFDGFISYLTIKEIEEAPDWISNPLMDKIYSNNLKHIVRIETMIGVNKINLENGYKKIFLCQQPEVIISEK